MTPVRHSDRTTPTLVESQGRCLRFLLAYTKFCRSTSRESIPLIAVAIGKLHGIANGFLGANFVQQLHVLKYS
ncbi:hypothetical protein [Nostoc sp. NMS9]|uniref:hypothetical protein n=1 Tax=Nostoc sp. NMS9 TaxID=2815393 RepID=UPI0025E116FC|nr:hypothetical protein [Nostoc sp. NMS9]MBN3941347.1 hypothetical protein [Nostoc sp. NMS9]